MSYIIDNQYFLLSKNESEEESFSDQYYEPYLLEADNSFNSITTSYSDEFAKSIIKSIVESEEFTLQQGYSLARFIEQIITIEDLASVSLTKDISVKNTIEDEIVFYRKCEKGIKLVSIDTDGDVLYNYTGYKNGFETITYKFEKVDFEGITYNFLAR